MIKSLLKRKNYLFNTGLLLLLLLIYQEAFRPTFEAWQTTKELKDSLRRFSNISNTPAYLQREDNNLTAALDRYRADTIALGNSIINSVALIAQAQNAKLFEVPVQDQFNHNDNFFLEQLKFEGDFFSLTRLSDQLEYTANIGVIRSESWKLPDPRTNDGKSGRLVLEIFIEIIKK